MGRYIPGHFRSPLGLAARLLRTGDRDAIGAMAHAAAGLLLAPLDMMWSRHEAQLYQRASAPALPQLLVCGPPRSGTSLVAQVLIAHLPVAYLSNVAGLFPRSPITAEQRIGPRLKPWHPAYHSYYGRVAALHGPNDSLALWDRWLGPDRTRVRDALTTTEGESLRRFFGALEAWSGKPLVAKNNNLNLQAAAVGAALPTARFLCLERDPLFLAQSLLAARRIIQGDEEVPYGLAPAPVTGEDPLDSVCRQVRFLRDGARAQREALGADRFRIIGYEDFCARPQEWIDRLGHDVLGIPADRIRHPPPDFRLTARTRPTLPPAEFDALERRLRQAGLAA